MQADTNKNVNHFNSPWSKIAYVCGILLFRAAAFAFVPKSLAGADAIEWTATNVVHGVIAFCALHWVRGSPIWEDQGEFIEKTAWEQIDNGVPWTDTRKFLILTPVILFGVSWYLTAYNAAQLLLNVTVVLVQVVAKLPELHGVRLFSVNQSTVSDD